MLWGYFFTSPDRSDLEKICAELVSNGYRLVEIRQLEPDSPQASLEWQLHVERVELQTVDALSARNTQLEGLARQYNNVIYDGMDVGPPTN
ncbi:regulator of ribonuclease activity B [Rhizobium sullae]|uniref:Regulator of ribonuclease activity B n=2 Tax=Rhizobium sullae TaxID=50338 RepID=A0A4R3PT10_RHISU|nr:regulator of ribonuclease activity B [Rhizobium sullae]